MDGNICGEVRLVDNILQAEDFVRLRIETGFAHRWSMLDELCKTGY